MTAIEKARDNSKKWWGSAGDNRLSDEWGGDALDAYELAYTEEHSKVEEYRESLKKQSAYTFELEEKVEARDKLLDEARDIIDALIEDYSGDGDTWLDARELVTKIDTLRKEGE